VEYRSVIENTFTIPQKKEDMEIIVAAIIVISSVEG
jgi:hypothetical protein